MSSSQAAKQTVLSVDAWIRALPPSMISLALGVFALASHLVFSVVVFPLISGPLQLGIDPDGFGVLAQNLVDGDGFRFDYGTEELTTYRAPAFPYLLAAGLALTGSVVVTGVLTQALIGALTVMVVFWIGTLVFDQRIGFVSGLLAAVHPMLIWWTPRLRYEPLVGLSVALMVLAAIWLLKEPSLLRGLLFGASVGLAALSAQITLPLAALITVAIVLMSTQRRQMTASAAVALLVAAALILPWTARNYAVTDGELILVQTGGVMEFVRGMYFVESLPTAPLRVTEIDRETDRRITEDFGDELGDDWFRGDRYVEDVLAPYAVEYISESPASLLVGFVQQLPLFWFLSESPAKSLFIAAIQIPLIVLAGIGVVLMVRRGLWLGVLVALPVVYFNTVYALFHAKARFSVPAVPFLIILAVAGLAMLTVDRRSSADHAR